MEWLNRIGIILNFLAGFMLAPELLGVERLRRAEAQLKLLFKRLSDIARLRGFDSFLYSIRQDGIGLVLAFLVGIVLCALLGYGLNKKVYWLSGLFGNPSLAMAILVAVVLILFPIARYWLTFLRAVWRFGVAAEIYMRTVPGVLETYLELMQGFFSLAVFVGTILILPFLALMLLPLAAVDKLLSFILKKLEAEDGLRTLVIYGGIAFFILGNLLQFVATFTG